MKQVTGFLACSLRLGDGVRECLLMPLPLTLLSTWLTSYVSFTAQIKQTVHLLKCRIDREGFL